MICACCEKSLHLQPWVHWMWEPFCLECGYDIAVIDTLNALQIGFIPWRLA